MAEVDDPTASSASGRLFFFLLTLVGLPFVKQEVDEASSFRRTDRAGESRFIARAYFYFRIGPEPRAHLTELPAS